MKNILVPIEAHPLIEPTLELASSLASHFESTLVGVALRPIQYQVVGAEPIVAVTLPPVEEPDPETARRARRIFDDFAAKKTGSSPVRFSWRAGQGVDDNELGSLARAFDITVVARADSAGQAPRMISLESALFDSGRPILIAPPKPPATLGERIVVAWNGSSETARTLALAMPLAKRAKHVTVLTIEGAWVPGPAGTEIVHYLSSHGIEATNVVRQPGSRKAGEAMLAEAAELGADLVIKGAYTQSRLRQMIFGGATSTILATTQLPVFMAH